MELTLLAAAVTAGAVVWLTLWADGGSDWFEHLLGAAVAGMLAGRLAAMLAAGVNPVSNPIDVLVVRGGVDTVTATVGGLGFAAWSVRGDLGALDRVAPAAVAGMAGWHGGCLWRGTCLGSAGEVPWGWALAGSEIMRHPVELYAAGLMAVGAIAIVRWAGPTGTRAALGLAVVAGARLVTEPLRPGIGTGPGWWYAAGLVVSLTAAMVLLLRSRLRAEG